jgi:hypothetical protein
MTNVLDRFDWKPQPEAGTLVRTLVNEFLSRCAPAANLAASMKDATGTRFVDWIDHLRVPRSERIESELKGTGFSHRPLPGGPNHWVHEGAMFPAIVVESRKNTAAFIKVDCVADFAATWRTQGDIQGEPLGQMRQLRVFAPTSTGDEMWVIERHGYRGFEVPAFDAKKSILARKHLETLRRRRRDFATDTEAFAYTNGLVDAAIADIGRDWTCDLWFEGERRYWQSRNRAARVQKDRQDRLGLGWANHDHHTYRSSRESFKPLVLLWEKLGFQARERFYAGAEAGWGAQVMEQPIAGITTFNDVDMSPEELLGDFSHDGLPASSGKLGTVGLWCALHGEAALQAGMHHLECQFDWHALKAQLESEANVRTMDPFTTFPYLRQAFTEGERWSVDGKRIDALLAQGFITKEQAETFRSHGAIGSHLENLERNDGFKGFNQKGVSDIIARTDPRRLAKPVAAGA